MKHSKWIVLLLVPLALFSGLVAGVIRFGFPENNVTAQELNGPWHYETDVGQAGEIFLPWDLAVPLGTGQVILSITLPEWEGEGHALHFVSMQQAVEVKIDGETRYTYGASVDDAEFVYRSATHLNRVPLHMADSGKELTIFYRTPPLFRIELGLLREVWFGTESDLVLHQFSVSLPVMLTTVFALLSVLSALLMVATYRGAPLRANFCTLLLTVMVLMPFTGEFSILWPLLDYTPKLSILYDWCFFFFDALIAPTVWLTMYASGWSFQGWRGRAVRLYGYAFVLAVALSLAGLFNFNLTRPIFIPCNILLTICLLVDRKKQGGLIRHCGLALPALILLGSYYLDYLKYCLMVLPISAKWSVFLQLKLQFQFFTGIALVVFPMLVLRVTISDLANRQAAVREENLKLQNSQQFLQQSSQAMKQRLSLMEEVVGQTRLFRHDQRHLNATLLELLQNGETEKATALINQQTAALPKSPICYCNNIAVNAAVSYYAALAEQRGIRCDLRLDIPEELHCSELGLSMVISNLIENAVHACEALPNASQRYLSVRTIYTKQLILQAENPYEGTVVLDEKGYPVASEPGHGSGTASIRAFIEECGGYIIYNTENGIFNVRILI